MLAIIGGTGLDRLDVLAIKRRESISTPFGKPSAALSHGELNGLPVVFLARHGDEHQFPPHKINYRANLWALKRIGATRIVAIAAVGGISKAMAPGRLAVPDQIVDYTYGREHTFFDGSANAGLAAVEHIDFSQPYCEPLRQQILQAARDCEINAAEYGTYGATEGPRLESTAEIRRMAQNGCDLVGMTGMPEAALARELDLDYAACAVVVNWAAGLTDNPITMAEIHCHLATGMTQVRRLLAAPSLLRSTLSVYD